MNRGMRRGALISFLIHGVILAALIITFPMNTIPEATDDSVDVDVVGPGMPQQGLTPSKIAAPMNTQTVNHAPLAVKTPKQQTIMPPPPPPPPPPPNQTTAPQQATLPPPPPPPPVQTPQPAQPVPPVKPHPPVKTPSKAEQPKTQVTPLKHAAPPKSESHQEHVVKPPPVLTPSQLAQLLHFQSSAPQKAAPTAHYNPEQGGAPGGGGVTKSTANSGLTGADRDAIANHIRPCFQIDPDDPPNLSVDMTVTTDGTGTIREANIAPDDASKLSDPIFNAFWLRAQAAALNVQCATLPLPQNLLGQNHTFLLNFTAGD